MKIIITFLLSVTFLPFVLSAQPMVTVNEYYELGDVITMVNVNPTSVAVGAPGAATWDFTGLSLSGGNSVTTVAANSTDSFATSNLLITMPNHDTVFMSENSSDSYVNAVKDHSTHITTTYDFYDIAKRPFAYGGYFLDTYKIDVAVPLTTGNGSLAISGDAYGTLKLPGETFSNVLRIRKLREETDTVSGAPTTFTIVTYMWFDSLHTAPLFRFDSTVGVSGSSNTASYLPASVGVSPLSVLQGSYTGYMQNDELQLTGNFEYGRTYNVVVYSVIGTKLYTGDFTATGNAQRIEIGRDVNPGIYIVSLTLRTDPSFKEVIKVVKQ